MKPCYIFIFLAAMPLVACHDDNSAPSSPIADKTYDASSGLELYYDGFQMPGKSVTFSQDGAKAQITAFSKFDLSQLSSLGLSGSVAAPGVVPGSPEITLSTNVAPSDGGWTFAGTSENDYCQFSYSGFATEKNLKLFISDVSLNAPISPEVWEPAPLEKNTDGSIKSMPLYFDWQFNPLPDVDFDFSVILDALATLPIIPVYNNTAYMSVSQALTEVLKTVAFKNDGNIIFSYVNNSFGSARLDQTQPNGYQYVVDSPKTVRLYVNPLSFFGLILNNTSPGTPADEIDLNAHGLFPADKGKSSSESSADNVHPILSSEIGKQMLKNAMEYLLPQLATGLPLSFDVTSSKLHIYLDTDASLSLINKIFLPLLRDNPTVEAIITHLSSDETLRPLLPYLKKALSLFAAQLEKTTTLRLGVTLVPYTPS